MKRLSIALALLLGSMTFSTATFAEAVNLRDLTCEAALELDEDAAFVLVFWLDGYLSGVTGDTTFDDGYIENFVNTLASYCEGNPGVSILEAAERVGTHDG